MPFSITSAKDLAVLPGKPLLLAEFTFSDGIMLRLSTDPLNVADGGEQYGGYDWHPRILEQNIARIQQLSEAGTDLIPSVDLVLADADSFIYGYERDHGFKGARLRLVLVMWNVGTTEFSTDSVVKFRGICDGLTDGDDETATVRAYNAQNLNRATLPQARCQRRCIHIFPATLAERTDAADNPLSVFHACGYSPDVAGGNARGNLNGGSAYTTCDYTKEACVARGMYTTDSSARQTGSFSGSQWAPPPSWSSRGYLDGKTITVENSANETKYGQRYPLVYGTAWVIPRVMNIVRDANYTKFECVLCFGYIGQTFTPLVVVNDVEIPKATAGSRTMWWNWVNDGSRYGSPNQDQFYNGQGDPYGSMGCIAVVVPRQLHDSPGPPNVRVLIQGLRVRVYSDAVTWAEQFSENPVWILLDLYRKAGYLLDEISITRAITAAAVCDSTMSHTDPFGATVNGPRFQAGLVITEPKPAGSLIQSFRRSFRCATIPNGEDDGKLEFLIESTLASQQSAPVTGSNDSDIYASKLPNGNAANGYVAYHFSEASIARERRGGKTTFRYWQQGIDDTPNRLSIAQFQDRENRWAPDSLTQVDAEDVGRIDQAIDETVRIEGIPTFDQGRRILATEAAKRYRGNPRNDTGGTLHVSFETTIRASHLRVGHIVSLSWAKLGLTKKLFRVIALQPRRNFGRVSVTLQWHNDDWYLDSYGQSNAPRIALPARDRLERPSFGLLPYQEQPPAGDALFDQTNWTFALAAVYEAGADRQIAKLRIKSKLPVNVWHDSLRPPHIPLQGNTGSGGGTIPAGVYFVRLAAIAGDSRFSAPTEIACQIDKPDTGTITVPNIVCHSGTSSVAVFAGTNPNRLPWQGTIAGSPTSITLTALNTATWGSPDGEFDRLVVRIRRVLHSGVWGAQVSEVGTGYVKIAGAAFTANEWQAVSPKRVVSLIGRDNQSDLPVRNFTVESNTADQLNLSPDPAAAGIQVGDVLVMRSRCTVTESGGNHVLSDAGWANCFSPSGLASGSEAGAYARIIAGAGAGQILRVRTNGTGSHTLDGKFAIAPDLTSVIVIEPPKEDVRQETVPQDVSSESAVTELNVEVSNLLKQTLGVEIHTLDGGGKHSFDFAYREIYLFGSDDFIVDGYVTLSIEDSEVSPDITVSLNFQVNLTQAVTVNNPAGTQALGDRVAFRFDQTSTGFGVTWGDAYKGANHVGIDLSPNTYSIFQFRWNGTHWELYGNQQGVSNA